jgi:bifunctional non-homologous end joining protein LigD
MGTRSGHTSGFKTGTGPFRAFDTVSLKEYRAKRHFERSPEPKGAAKPGAGPLRFVVQKHQASRLHYDFRLEIGGTLKSWAVPKGPSVNPEDKRLAVMVEDHPLEYARFEGVIPKGSYGAGTVMIWDEGTYEVPGTTDRTQSETELEEGLRQGHLSFVLHGKKLKGRFSLLKLKKGDAKSWLLVKKQDDYAAAEDVRAKDRSVTSRRSMEGIALKGPTRAGKGELDLTDAPKAALPRNVKPMLAAAVDRSFDKPGWMFEIKWDGYRAIAEVTAKKTRLYSRKQLSFGAYGPIVESLKKLGHEAVLDGEIVVLDEAGKSQFQLLQNYKRTKAGPLVYYVFDLLYLDGHDLRGLPLLRRKQILAAILGDLPNIKLSDHVEERGVAFFDAVAERGLEGMIAKDGAGRYHEGRRSKSWLKVKTGLRQDAIICGYTEPRGSRENLGSLILGVYDDGNLVYIGNAGSGFTRESLADVWERLGPLHQEKAPFKKPPKTDMPAHWVKPELVCQVAFAGWSSDGHLRFPIFQGVREDMPPHSVRRENPEALKNAPVAEKPALEQGPGKLGPKGVPVKSDDPIPRLTNLDKVYWPEDNYTKGDLVAYYREISRFILPYLKDRPQSLNRHPNGIHGKSFFQKDVSKQPPPEWVHTVDLRDEGEGKTHRTPLCQDEASLLYLANLGCIELNPWNARVGSLDHADYLLIDLDPEKIAFDQVVETAQAVRKLLDGIGATSVCKTSGKRGLHIYIPLGARYTHDQAKQFAELVVNIVHRELPDTTSVLRLPQQRQHRVYLDWLQNGKGKTLAAPYSVRPAPGATVSAPLKWTEVRRGLDPAAFTIKTMPKRLAKVGDLWKPVLSAGIDLHDCLERLARLLERKGRKKV